MSANSVCGVLADIKQVFSYALGYGGDSDAVQSVRRQYFDFAAQCFFQMVVQPEELETKRTVKFYQQVYIAFIALSAGRERAEKRDFADAIDGMQMTVFPFQNIRYLLFAHTKIILKGALNLTLPGFPFLCGRFYSRYLSTTVGVLHSGRGEGESRL